MFFVKSHKTEKWSEKTYPDTTKLLWIKGLAMRCDHYDFQTPFADHSYIGIKKDDLVWVRDQNLKKFADDVLPEVTEPFVLLTGDSDLCVPDELPSDTVKNIVSHDCVIKWYAQNEISAGKYNKKLKPIPIGIDFHSQYEKKGWRFHRNLTPAEQEELMTEVKKRHLPVTDRILKIYADFHLNNSSKKLKKRMPSLIKKTRHDHFKELKKNPVYYFQKKRLKRHLLWNEMSRHRFVISPHGTGMDCHRTWEALGLGCYVIVESSPLDCLYENLPVKIVKDFRDITVSDLTLWARDFESRFPDSVLPAPLTNGYWFENVKNRY